MSTPTEPRIRRSAYPLVVAGLISVLLVTFAVVEHLEVPLLSDPVPVLSGAGPAAAAIGVGLLVADVALPAPSSIIMTLHGAVFGVVGGAALSLLGGTGATIVAVVVGRRGRRALERLALPEHRARAEGLFARYGTVAVVATRPVPVLAETVAIVAGTAGMPLGRAAWAGALGNVIPAAAYAAAGATAASVWRVEVIFAAVLALSLLVWLVPVLVRRAR